jgi:hypothetical protein
MKRFNDSPVSTMCMVLVGLVCLSITTREAAAQAPSDAKYLMIGDGTIVAIRASGESYYSRRLPGGGLAQTVHLGNFWEAVAGWPIDPQYEMHENGIITAIDRDNGNVYRGGVSDSTLLDTSYIGNLWEAVAGLPIDPYYEMHANGMITVIDRDNGEVYYGGLIDGVLWDPMEVVGSYWDGVTATEKSSWGGLKNIRE